MVEWYFSPFPSFLFEPRADFRNWDATNAGRNGALPSLPLSLAEERERGNVESWLFVLFCPSPILVSFGLALTYRKQSLRFTLKGEPNMVVY